jgi:hypothetical protein
MTTTNATARLQALGPACAAADAEALFDSLPAVRPEELTGRYAGRELATGHPMDGLLESSGWYGKQFDDVDHVHPLLFRDLSGAVFPVEPRMVPLVIVPKVPAALVARSRSAIGTLKPLLSTRKHRARLRAVDHRGVVTAAMVYDHQPIIDYFRRVDADTLLGMMDLRRAAPYYFVLTRD